MIKILGADAVSIIARGFYFGVLLTGVATHQADAADDDAQLSKLSHPSSAHEGAAGPSAIEEAQRAPNRRPRQASFELERASPEARHVANWVVDSGDNRSMPFAIIDKADAKVFLFYADGRLRGAAPALLGLARGDHAVPGIGDRKLSSIHPDERTTPAGRFVASLDRNLRGKEILWVNYDDAISLHPVITTKPAERRAERLASLTPLDNRISYGCINVPAKFFENVVRPAFTGTDGIVYVLPETKPARELFGSYDVDEHAREHSKVQPLSAAVPSETAAH